MNNAGFKKLRQRQNDIIASTPTTFVALLSLSPLATNAIKSVIRNDKLIASLCYMSDKSLEEIKEICQKLPYALADIQAYYRMYGKFPE